MSSMDREFVTLGVTEDIDGNLLATLAAVRQGKNGRSYVAVRMNREDLVNHIDNAEGILELLEDDDE